MPPATLDWRRHNNNNNNNNKLQYNNNNVNVYPAIDMAQPLREFTW